MNEKQLLWYGTNLVPRVTTSLNVNVVHKPWMTSLILWYCHCREVGGGKRLPVDRSNLLLRGCVLRNTTRVAGLVVYAGTPTQCVYLNMTGTVK